MRQTTTHPGTTIPVTGRPEPLDAPLEPVSSHTLPRAQLIFGVEPQLLRLPAAGKRLGLSGRWLQDRWPLHILYRPTVPSRGRGYPALYHIEHLDLITEHLMDPEHFTEDNAWQAWERLRRNVKRQFISGEGRRSGGPRRRGG